MEKELTGYKILKKVWGFKGYEWFPGATLNIENRESLLYFKELGILNDTSIFEPIYKDITIDIKEGDYIYMMDVNGIEVDHYDTKYNGDVLKVTSFKKEDYKQYPNSYWLKHTPLSFSGGGFRVDKSAWRYGINFRKATKEEIKNYENNLILEEAKKRYPLGTKVKLIPYNNGGNFGNEVRFTNHKFLGDQLYVDGNLLIYENGKWAEILPSYPVITINGYKGEFFPDYVKFGCAKISKHIFRELHICQALKDIHEFGNKEVTSVTIGSGVFSKKQIQEIAEYYLKK